MADEFGIPPEDEKVRGYTTELAAVQARIDAMKAARGEGKFVQPQLREYQSLCMKKACLVKALGGKRPKGPELRLVKAVAAERVANRAVEEAAQMVADTTQVLRLAVNEYGRIARRDLAEHLLKRLHCGDPEKEDEAARRLQDLFEKIVDTQSDLRMRAAGKKARPGWPSEGAKS